MRNVVQVIQNRSATFEQHPFFAFLRDEKIEPEDRLAFVPNVAYYVVSYGELCKVVFREEPAKDRFQEIVNEQTYEEGDHWRWFVTDLEKLGYDPTIRFSDALRFLWSEEALRSRKLVYHLCRLALGADSLRKLIVVHCAEATASVTVKHAVLVGKQWSKKHGRNLAFFGRTHDDAEEDHSLWGDQVLKAMLEAELKPGQEEQLIAVVHEAFDAFTAFVDEMLATARAGRRPTVQAV